MSSIDFEKELFKQVSLGTGKSSFALLVNIVVIIFAFYGSVPTLHLVVWFFVVSFLLYLRYHYSTTYLKNTTSLSVGTLTSHFKLVSILIALSVSSGIIYLTPATLPFHQAFLAMIVAGLSAGVVMALSYYQSIMRIYLAILIIPFATLMLSYGNKLHILIAILMYLFFVMLILFSKKFYDNFKALVESKHEVYYQAHYDQATGLANRHTLYDRLLLELSRLKRTQHKAALLFIDMDNFKTINDSYGHHLGDMTLKLFATALSSMVRECDTLARFGGDEFIILLSDIQAPTSETKRIAQELAQRIHTYFKHPIEIEHHKITITMSIGIKIIQPDNQNLKEILIDADKAMYTAKERGKNQTHLID